MTFIDHVILLRLSVLTLPLLGVLYRMSDQAKWNRCFLPSCLLQDRYRKLFILTPPYLSSSTPPPRPALSDFRCESNSTKILAQCGIHVCYFNLNPHSPPVHDTLHFNGSQVNESDLQVNDSTSIVDSSVIVVHQNIIMLQTIAW